MIKAISLFSVLFSLTTCFKRSNAIADVSIRGNIGANIAKTYFQLLVLLSQARNQGSVCEVEAYPYELVKVTSRIANTGSFHYAEKIEDNRTIMEAMGSDVAFRYVLGKFTGLNTPSQYENALIGVKVYGPGHGVLGSTEYEIKSNGELVQSIPTWNDKDEVEVVVKKGKWALKVSQNPHDYRVIVNFTVEGITRSFGLEFNEVYSEGWVTLVPLTETEDEKLYSFPSECEA